MINSEFKGDELLLLAKAFIDKLADGTISKSEAIAFLQTESRGFAPLVPVEVQLGEWGAFLKSIGCACDMEMTSIPQYRRGLDHIIIVPSAMTMNRIVELMGAKLDVWVHPEFGNNVDAAVPQNDRHSDQTYAVWTRDQVEPDEDFSNMSAEDIREPDVSVMTLLERLLLGAFKLHHKKGHLDVIGGTLCAGSRTQSGKVPCVEWSDESCQLGITVRSPRGGSPLTRARQVVS